MQKTKCNKQWRDVPQCSILLTEYIFYIIIGVTAVFTAHCKSKRVQKAADPVWSRSKKAHRELRSHPIPEPAESKLWQVVYRVVYKAQIGLGTKHMLTYADVLQFSTASRALRSSGSYQGSDLEHAQGDDRCYAPHCLGETFSYVFWSLFIQKCTSAKSGVFIPRTFYSIYFIFSALLMFSPTIKALCTAFVFEGCLYK